MPDQAPPRRPPTSPGRRIGTASALTAAAVVTVIGLGACGGGPSTKTELCSSFDALGHQLPRGNGVFGNPLFRAAGNLGDVAVRYGDTAIAADGKRLRTIADSDSTSAGDLMDATRGISRVCGHQLKPF